MGFSNRAGEMPALFDQLLGLLVTTISSGQTLQ
jgi:hypothetical protein